MKPRSSCSSPLIKLLAVGWLLVAVAGLDVAADENRTLSTRWAAEVSGDNALPEYPRPQLRRGQWQSLNGKWDYAIRPQEEDQPESFDGQILVPYPIESLLSGVQEQVNHDQHLWYRRSFQVPAHSDEESVLLNFGAVDWSATVWVNGKQVGKHQGGYDPFTFDITDAITPGENELVVSVWDPTDEGVQPRGKQIRRPHGIWYTAVTGIWQTVWLEVVPEDHIRSLRLSPDAEHERITVVVNTAGNPNEDVEVVVQDGGQAVASGHGKAGSPITIGVPKAKLWSPHSPHLYDLIITTAGGDKVESYFGLRDVALGKDAEGITRITINGEPLFQYGLLDQGWWPDGLYTAPTDEALRYDLEVAKKLGFNMLRKHVKVEPARWYYWCDKLGILVWQDMPSGDKYIGGNEPDIQRSKESGDNFERELEAMVDTLFNHPSIVMWVPYNEGWGQWDTARISRLLKRWDETRLVNSASGWVDRGVGDVHDIHSYPGPAMPSLEDNRAAVLGEFGGLGRSVPGHLWQNERNWGYRSYENGKDFTDAYRRLVTQLRFLVGEGLSAAVYTQLTDVEIEVNGILTYDRDVVKLPQEMAETNEMLYKPAPRLKTLVATSESEPQTWRYTFNDPSVDWYNPSYDDSHWNIGEAGFGGHSPPGVIPRTEWVGNRIWLRRVVEFPNERVSTPLLRIYHDEDAEVYIDGRRVASLSGYSTDYVLYPIDKDLRRHLKPGPMTIAVHCQQTLGGQYIDVGIVDIVSEE